MVCRANYSLLIILDQLNVKQILSPEYAGTLSVYVRSGSIPDPRTFAYHATCSTAQKQLCQFEISQLPETRALIYVLVVGNGAAYSQYSIGVTPVSDKFFSLSILEFSFLIAGLFLFAVLAGLFFMLYLKDRLANPEPEREVLVQ